MFSQSHANNPLQENEDNEESSEINQQLSQSRTYHRDECKKAMDQLGPISNESFASYIFDDLSLNNTITNHNQNIPNQEYIQNLIHACEITRLVDKGRGLEYKKADGLDTQYGTNERLLKTIINKYINIADTETTLFQAVDKIFRSMHANDPSYIVRMTQGRRPKLATIAKATARSFIQSKMHPEMSNHMFKQRMHIVPYKDDIYWMFVNGRRLVSIVTPHYDGNENFIQIEFSQDTANISENKIVEASKWCQKVFNYGPIREMHGTNRQKLDKIFFSGHTSEVVFDLLIKIKHSKKKYYLPFITILNESELDKHAMRNMRLANAPRGPIGPSEKGQAIQDKMDELILQNENNKLLIEQLNNEKETLVHNNDSLKLRLYNQNNQTKHQHNIIQQKKNQIKQLESQFQKEKDKYSRWAQRYDENYAGQYNKLNDQYNNIYSKYLDLKTQQQQQQNKSIPLTPSQNNTSHNLFHSQQNQSIPDTPQSQYSANSYNNNNNNNNNNSLEDLLHIGGLNVSNTEGIFSTIYETDDE